MGLPLISRPLREFRMWQSWSLVTSVNILFFYIYKYKSWFNYLKSQIMVMISQIADNVQVLIGLSDMRYQQLEFTIDNCTSETSSSPE